MTILNTTPFENPNFQRADRPVYEMGHMLSSLPADLAPADMNPEKRLIAGAVKQHAGNGASAAFNHIQCLGELLFVAGGNESHDVSSECLQDLGYLMKSIADQGQLMMETQDRMRYLLGEYDHLLDEKLKEMGDALPNPPGRVEPKDEPV